MNTIVSLENLFFIVLSLFYLSLATVCGACKMIHKNKTKLKCIYTDNQKKVMPNIFTFY